MDDQGATGTDGNDWFAPRGDRGLTHFGAHGEIAKHDVRLAAYGECAEANAAIGVAMSVGRLPVDITALLTSVQNDMLDDAADLSVPLNAAQSAAARISSGHLRRLERAVRHYGEGVEEPYANVLPGGTVAAALLYHSRNVVRRAERTVWAALAEYPQALNPAVAQYLNRVSTLLLLLARTANAEHGNLSWKPGASAAAMDDGDVGP